MIFLEDRRIEVIIVPSLSYKQNAVGFIKVTVDLQGCLSHNHSYARREYYNHRKVYIIVKLIKCKISKKTDTIC